MLKLKNKRIYYLLTALFITCYLIRALELPLPAFLYNHISNFAITGGLVMLASFNLLLVKGYTRRKLLITLMPFAVLNIVLEFFVRVGTIKLDVVEFVNLNTPDPLDAVFGILSLVLIYFVAIYFAVPMKKATKKTSPKRG